MFGPRQITLPLLGPGSSRVEPLADYPDQGEQREPGSDFGEGPELQGRLFDEGGAQLTFAAWSTKFAANLVAAGKAFYDAGHDKAGRSWKRRAFAFTKCGSFCERRTCTECGVETTTLIADCDVRACPRCARVKSGAHFKALHSVLESFREKGQMHRRGDGRLERYASRMLTLTARYDPSDPSDFTPESMRARWRVLWLAWGRILKEVLRYDAFGVRVEHVGIWGSTEVSFGGLVHLHSAVYGIMLSKEQLAHARSIVNEELAKIGRDGNIDLTGPLRGDDLREVCKYLTKASGFKRIVRGGTSRWMDPALAAIVEVAFFRRHTTRGRGSLRAINKLAEDLEEVAREDGARGGCVACGSHCAESQWIPVRLVRMRDVWDKKEGRWRTTGLDGVAKPPGHSRWKEAQKKIGLAVLVEEVSRRFL